MDSQFWLKAWKEGKTNFHQDDYHPKLTQYFPLLNPQKGQKVLVPLCGKSKDLLWLREQHLLVHGVELSTQAVEEFFSENKLGPIEKTQDPDFIHRTYQNMIISCGDFFNLNKNQAYDFVYDRAALVALPAPMRKKYVRVIEQALKNGGKYLLIVYEYDQTKMEGPPFSIDNNEIQQLYQNQFSIRLIESERPKNEGPRLASLASIHQKVYILEKRV